MQPQTIDNDGNGVGVRVDGDDPTRPSLKLCQFLFVGRVADVVLPFRMAKNLPAGNPDVAGHFLKHLPQVEPAVRQMNGVSMHELGIHRGVALFRLFECVGGETNRRERNKSRCDDGADPQGTAAGMKGSSFCWICWSHDVSPCHGSVTTLASSHSYKSRWKC